MDKRVNVRNLGGIPLGKKESRETREIGPLTIFFFTDTNCELNDNNKKLRNLFRKC